MKILVGSTNPVKIEAVKESFERFYDDVVVEGIAVSSGVTDQPVGKETFDGARNRAIELRKMNFNENLNADFFVGIEGGISEDYGIWLSFGAVCIIDKEGREAFGTSPKFQLPRQIVTELLSGVELGTVMDKIQNKENTKQHHGAIGYFTKGRMDRKELYVSGIVASMVPLLNKELFFNAK